MFLRTQLATLAVAAITATTALAQDIGVKVTQIPKGTKIFYQDGHGKTWVEIFNGKKGKNYVLTRYKNANGTGRPTSIMHFDKNGRMKFLYGYGNRSARFKMTYSPRYCGQVFGNCTHKARFTGSEFVNHGQSTSWAANTSKKGKTYTAVWENANGESRWALQYTLGKYNLRQTEQWLGKRGLEKVKIIEIRKPKS